MLVVAAALYNAEQNPQVVAWCNDPRAIAAPSEGRYVVFIVSFLELTAAVVCFFGYTEEGGGGEGGGGGGGPSWQQIKRQFHVGRSQIDACSSRAVETCGIFKAITMM